MERIAQPSPVDRTKQTSGRGGSKLVISLSPGLTSQGVRTLVIGTLGTTVKVLASVFGDPDVVSSLVSEVLDVLLESLDGNIVPMEGQEATISTCTMDQRAQKLTRWYSRRQSFQPRHRSSRSRGPTGDQKEQRW